MAGGCAVGVDEVVGAVMDALRAAGYRETTLIRYRTLLRRLAAFCWRHGGEYTCELGALFATQTTSPVSGMFSIERWFDHGRCARLADSYLALGYVDLSMQRKVRQQPSSGQFADLLAGWDADMRCRGLAESTKYQCREAARRFLLHAEASGVDSVAELTGAQVIGFVDRLGETNGPAGLRSFLAALRPFLTFTGQPALGAGLSGLRFERQRLIVPVLTEEETSAVYAVLGSGQVDARDRSIVLLALTMGLRAADIVELQIEDIDWRGARISLVQTKTGNRLTLPLLPVVGNAISEYLLNQRPATMDRGVFVRRVAPYTGLSDHAAVYAVMKRVFGLAGLEPGRCGARLTRHNVASKMLISRTPMPTISAVLGHVDPASADRYLSTDTDSLRACVLPVPKAALR